MTIQLSGFYSGLDTGSIVEQLTALNRIPILELEAEKLELDDQSSALGFIETSLQSLQSKLDDLNDSQTFQAKTVTAADTDSTIGTATVDTTASAGTVKIQITQLATNSRVESGDKATSVPAGTATVSDVFGSNGEGYFYINNTKITLSSTTTMDEIATAIAAADGINSAGYDSGTGKFTIDGTAGSLVLGSSGDTSTFLQEAQLFNSNIDGSGDVTSSIGVGRITTSSDTIGTADFAGGSVGSDGTITINGVDISYSTSDSIDTLLSNITDSDAGVVATYDSYSDRFVLTSKERGAIGISVSDSSGNLAEAMQLRTGTDTTVSVGDSTQFKVNDGDTRESTDSTLDEEELGIQGLTFNAIDTGTANLTISADVTSIQSTIDAFIEQYNSVQNMIESYANINTDNTENSGILAHESTITFLASDLRNIVGSRFSETNTIQMLEDLGIEGNDSDNTLTLSDSTKLQDALEDNLDDVIALFTDSTDGLHAKLDPIIDAYSNSTSGSIQTRQDSITDQKTYIDDEIERLEAQVEAERLYLESQFAVMEQYQAQSTLFSGFFANSSTATTT